MMIVSVVIGGTLTALTRAEAVSRQKRRQMVRIMLCEDALENIRHQWITSPDPIASLYAQIDPDEQLPEPMHSLGWRDTAFRCPWPISVAAEYAGRYRIQALLKQQVIDMDYTTDVVEEVELDLDPVRAGTLYRLDVSVSSDNRNNEITVLSTFLAVPGPLNIVEEAKTQ